MSPRSIAHKSATDADCGRDVPPQPFILDDKNTRLSIVYTYSVVFEPSGECVCVCVCVCQQQQQQQQPSGPSSLRSCRSEPGVSRL